MITPKLQTRRDRLADRGLRSVAWRRRCVGWVIDAAGVRVAGATYKFDSVRAFDFSSGFRDISKKKLSLKKVRQGLGAQKHLDLG